MRVLKSPSVSVIENIVVSSKKDYVFMLAYMENSYKKHETVINTVRKFAKEKENDNSEFYEIVITEDDKDTKKQFEVGNQPTLFVFSGGWLLYKSTVPSVKKAERVMMAVKSLPRFEFATDEYSVLSGAS